MTRHWCLHAIAPNCIPGLYLMHAQIKHMTPSSQFPRMIWQVKHWFQSRIVCVDPHKDDQASKLRSALMPTLVFYHYLCQLCHTLLQRTACTLSKMQCFITSQGPGEQYFPCFHGNPYCYHGNRKILLPWGIQLHHIFCLGTKVPRCSAGVVRTGYVISSTRAQLTRPSPRDN